MLFLRPFFSYFGSKWRLAPSYPRPEHPDLIEPFAGGAGYACRHYKKRVLLIEKDPRIAALWAWLIKVSPEEVMRIPLFDNGIESVDDMKGISDDAKTLVGFWSNHGTSAPRKRPSKWIRESGNGWTVKSKLLIAAQVQRIRHWRAIHGSYEDAPDIQATWYVDPPYEVQGTNYTHGSQSLDFPALGSWCCARRGLAIVCENAGAKWLPFEHHAYMSGGTKEVGGARMSEEVVYIQRR